MEHGQTSSHGQSSFLARFLFSVRRRFSFSVTSSIIIRSSHDLAIAFDAKNRSKRNDGLIY